MSESLGKKIKYHEFLWIKIKCYDLNGEMKSKGYINYILLIQDQAFLPVIIKEWSFQS